MGHSTASTTNRGFPSGFVRASLPPTMGVFLPLLDRLRLGGRALLSFSRIEQARARAQALTDVHGPVVELAGAGSPPAPPPGPGHERGVVLRYLAEHHPLLRPDVELVEALWRSTWAFGEPPRADASPLREVVDWANWELEYARHPPLLVIGTAVAELLTLSPFPRGNIRIAKVWATLLMLRSQYSYLAILPLDEAVRRSGDRLRASRERLAAEPGSEALELWIEVLLGCLVDHAEAAVARLEQRLDGPALPELQARLLSLVRQEGRLTSRRAQEITQVSRNTLKDNFKRLVDAGLLERHGQRRGVFYTVGRAPEMPEGTVPGA